MAIVAGHDYVCVEICDALGIKRAKRLNLNMEVGNIVTIEVTSLVYKENLKKLIPILKKYHLVETDPPIFGLEAWKIRTYKL